MYAWLIEGLYGEDRKKADEQIFEPPPNMAAEKMAELPQWQPEEIGNSFMATMMMRGQQTRAN